MLRLMAPGLGILLIATAACGGSSPSANAPAQSASECPLPPGLEARIREAFAGSAEPKWVVGRGSPSSVTLTVVETPASPGVAARTREEKVEVEACASYPLDRLIKEFKGL